MKPISATAFYCCGVRMKDAEADKPVCGDQYAKIFMNEEGMRIYEAFKDEVETNAGIAARHRIIDDLLRQELSADPNLRIVLIGAGFDTRAYRLKGGKWAELDEPQIIAYKNERLPIAECNNELQRIPVDFSTDSLEQKLLQFSTDNPVVVVIEGVFIYLREDVIERLLNTLRLLFGNHKMICDLMTRKFFEKYGRTLHEKIVQMGASFIVMDAPHTIFIDSGYRLAEKISIVLRAIELRSIRIPTSLFRLFFRTLSNGYSVHVFEYESER
jgi:methyltransferase (TIGR00027 family)